MDPQAKYILYQNVKFTAMYNVVPLFEFIVFGSDWGNNNINSQNDSF